jgi:hypothetical protein
VGAVAAREPACEVGRVAARVFLLSPASSAGKRCELLLREGATSELARRVHGAGAPIGEVFTFLSSLYFRGKLTYAQRFAAPPGGCAGVLVITADRGLVAPETLIAAGDLRAFARVPIDAADERYAEPLRRDAGALRARLGDEAEVVLLGSIATAKYVDVLLGAFGAGLRFPGAFVGRGDMSRGGLLLRAAHAGAELEYAPVAGAVRRGARPARLAKAGRAPIAGGGAPAGSVG